MTSENEPSGYSVLSAEDLRPLEYSHHVIADMLAYELGALGPSSFTGGEIQLSMPSPLDASDLGPEHQGRFEFQFLVGDPPLVVVTALDAGIIEVAQYRFVWTGAHDGSAFRRNGSIALVPAGWGDPMSRTQLLLRLVRQVAANRRRSFRRCRYCPEPCPPEHMYDKDLCHSHASEHLGIVY
jgi:hypothetical protein